MPFTFAHPAIILPLNQSKLFSITALIAGSMVPDFEYFIQMREVENIGHRWYGILLFNFPIALLFCFLFHNLLRNALIIHLPECLSHRLTDILDFDWNAYALKNKWKITISVLVGIVSHLLLDAFTHHDGYFVEIFSILTVKTRIYELQIPVYFSLQLVLSVVGLIAIIHVMLQIPQKFTRFNKEKNKWYWPLFAFTLSLMLCIRLAGWPEYNSFWGVFMALMGSLCYSWVFISVLFKNFSNKKIIA